MSDDMENRQRSGLVMDGSKQLEKFDFDHPEHWLQWLNKFERFRILNGLDQMPEEKQVRTLIQYMRGRKDETGNTFDIPLDDYQAAVDKLTVYFSPRTNIILERSKFHSRVQGKDESFDDYLASLFSLMEVCGFDGKWEGLRNELMRDRLVTGIRDPSLREHLQTQMEEKLTLEKTIEICRDSKEEEKPFAFDPVIGILRERKRKKMERWLSLEPTQNEPEEQPKESCPFCGEPHRHPKHWCPANSAVCYSCGCYGHFAWLCPKGCSSSQAGPGKSSVSQTEEEVEQNVTSETEEQDQYSDSQEFDIYQEIYVHQFGGTMHFLLDIDALRVCVPYRQIPLPCRENIQRLTIVPDLPDVMDYTIIGTIAITLVFNSKSYSCDALVMTGLRLPILSYHAIQFFNFPKKSTKPVDSGMTPNDENAQDP